MCKYCDDDHEKRVALEAEYDGIFRLSLSKCTPLPMINLTTGAVSDSAEDPYWVLYMEDPIATQCGFSAEREAYRIKYCPICGRLLPTKEWV